AVLGRLDSVVARGTEALGRPLLARADPPTARELVELVATPLVAALTADPVRGSRWLKIVSTVPLRNAARLWPEPQEALIALVSRAYPEIPGSERLVRFAIAFSTLTHVLAQAPSDTSSAGHERRDGYIRACVDFVTTGLDGAMARYSANRVPAEPGPD